MNRKTISKIFLYFAIGLFFLAVISSFLIEIKLLLVLFFALLLLASWFFYKEKIGQELIIAFLFGLFITTYYHYEYSVSNLFLGKITLFPLICWTFGLVLMREMYEKIHVNYRFFLVSIVYWAVLFLVEYAGYYLINIRLNSAFSSLFGLGIIHAPIGMKVFYLLAGSAYLLITDYLKVK